MQVREYSGEEFEHVAREIWVPMIARTSPDFRGRSAVQELSEALNLSRSHFRAPVSLVRTGRMAARASADDVMVFCVYMAGRGRVRQRDRLAVSVSQVYSLFERIGTTPAAYLREQRLLAARVMLSDPRYGRLGTSDIAAAVGFLDRRTFDRAFRRQYGMTPGGWRREHCRPGSTPATLGQEMPHS